MSSTYVIDKSSDNGENWTRVSWYGKAEWDELDDAREVAQALATPTAPLWRVVEMQTTQRVVSTIDFMGASDADIVAAAHRRSERRRGN